MAKQIELTVHLAKDDETGRWYIAQSDIPGLWLEADTAEQLVKRLSEAAPEIIALNEAEIDGRHKSAMTANRRHSVNIRPVFDSPLRLAYAM